MNDTIASSALDRIERAVARIEAAGRPEPADPGLAEAYAALERRHGILQARVQQTIERLDALMAESAEPRL